MVVVPGESAVTTPVALTVATLESLTDHVPPAGDAVMVACEPLQIIDAPDIAGDACTLTRRIATQPVAVLPPNK